MLWILNVGIAFALLTQCGTRRVILLFLGVVIFAPMNFLHNYATLVCAVAAIGHRRLQLKGLSIIPIALVCLILIGCEIAGAKLGVARGVYLLLRQIVLPLLCIVAMYGFLRNKQDCRIALNVMIWGVVFYSIYGLYVYSFGVNPFRAAISGSGFNMAEVFMDSDVTGRARVSSLFGSPFAYGFSLCLALLVAMLQIWDGSRKLMGTILLCLVLTSLWMTNCRSPIIAAIIGGWILIVLGLSWRGGFVWVCVAALGILMADMTGLMGGMSADSSIGMIADVFRTGGKTVGGSDIGTRIEQVGYASMMTGPSNMLFGNGVGYIKDGLGYDGQGDYDLFVRSFEGFAVVALLELGVVGLVTFAGLWTWLSVLFLVSAYKCTEWPSRREYLFGLANVASWVVFVMISGELGMALWFYSIMAVCLKMAWLNRVEGAIASR